MCEDVSSGEELDSDLTQTNKQLGGLPNYMSAVRELRRGMRKPTAEH